MRLVVAVGLGSGLTRLLLLCGGLLLDFEGYRIDIDSVDPGGGTKNLTPSAWVLAERAMAVSTINFPMEPSSSFRMNAVSHRIECMEIRRSTKRQ
jgi:hypothetical protein